MEPAPILAMVVALGSAGASYFFSLAETSLFSLSKWQVRQLAEKQPLAGGLVGKLLSESLDLLSAMVLGNTFASAAMLAPALWLALNGVWPLWSTVALLLLFILIVCEVLPKTMAVRSPERWALHVARPLNLVVKATRGLCRGAQRVNAALLQIFLRQQPSTPFALTDADYQELLEMAFQQGALAQSEKEIILQIISLDLRTVKEVMKPRAQMAAIADDLSVEEMLAEARKHRHRRLPLYDESPDTIVGVLNTRALLLDPYIDLADAIELPSFVPETMNLLQLLKSLQRQQRGLAIVLDEFGGTAGVVTMEDILEELIGSIRGEAEEDRLILEKLGAGKWRVAGTLRVDDFRRECPALASPPEVETMGGLLMSLLDVVPRPGESANYKGFKLTAMVADERRVREVLVESAEKPTAARRT